MGEGIKRRRIGWGEPAPWFTAPALDASPTYVFHTVAGRHVVLLFHGPLSDPRARAALDAVEARRALFDDVRLCFFGIATDPADAAGGRIAQQLPGIRFFLDPAHTISTLYGAAASGDLPPDPHWLILDPRLRAVASFDIGQVDAALDCAAALSGAAERAPWAPVLAVPRVFEPALCRRLIDRYEREGAEESGFMREVNGRTVAAVDHAHKRRADHVITDQVLCDHIAQRIRLRLLPAIEAAFQFNATRMERYIVARYDAEVGGHFRAHRDNTTKGTAHRRFAVTINLNADYDGGDLAFPEFGSRTYRAEVGGAIVFSCSLLHEARPVTKGRRYAFLPFLYDEAGAALREANAGFVDLPAAATGSR